MDLIVQKEVVVLCGNLKKELNEKINILVDYYGTLECQPKNQMNDKVEAILKKMTTEWTKESDKYVSMVVMNHLRKKLDDCLKKGQAPVVLKSEETLT